MPVFLRYHGWIFFIYSADCGERPHVHIGRSVGTSPTAKFWIDEVELFSASGLTRRELRQIERTIEDHQEHLLAEWRRFCEG